MIIRLAAIDRLNDQLGYNFGARRFYHFHRRSGSCNPPFCSRKTSGKSGYFLHAADDDLRTSMLPVNKRYPIDELLALVVSILLPLATYHLRMGTD